MVNSKSRFLADMGHHICDLSDDASRFFLSPNAAICVQVKSANIFASFFKLVT